MIHQMFYINWFKVLCEISVPNHLLSHLRPSSSPAVALSDGFNRNIERRNSTRTAPSSSLITPYRSRASCKLTMLLTRIHNHPNLYMSIVTQTRSWSTTRTFIFRKLIMKSLRLLVIRNIKILSDHSRYVRKVILLCSPHISCSWDE